MGVKLNVLDPKSTGSVYFSEKFQKVFDEIARECRFDEITVDDISSSPLGPVSGAKWIGAQ